MGSLGFVDPLVIVFFEPGQGYIRVKETPYVLHARKLTVSTIFYLVIY